MESFAGALTSAEEHNLQHEVLSADEVNNRFPGYNFPSHFKALYQPQGGYLESELAIKTHVSMAEKLGADVMVESPISRWEVLPDGRVKVETSENVYYTNKLVLSAGAWMHKLVPELTACVPERQVVAWFDISRPGSFQKTLFPVFNVEDESGRWYGFPQHGDPGFKIGRYRHRGQITTGGSRCGPPCPCAPFSPVSPNPTPLQMDSGT
mmetsp:Transcript_28300/g.79874  ORF Transcript_28300/g.79874 Transcript_28300/m.79874 type:complete len:209 (-) Transcript_28300:692-1318(-)